MLDPKPGCAHSALSLSRLPLWVFGFSRSVRQELLSIYNHRPPGDWDASSGLETAGSHSPGICPVPCSVSIRCFLRTLRVMLGYHTEVRGCALGPFVRSHRAAQGLPAAGAESGMESLTQAAFQRGTWAADRLFPPAIEAHWPAPGSQLVINILTITPRVSH